MEYLKYGDLSRYATVGLPEAEIKEIIQGVTQGLEVMHRYGFTHRDIKPQNILVVQKRPESPFWWVKISDFGISKQILSTSSTALHTLVGTRDYCAPEILGLLESHETADYSNKVDMWSLGCVLFNLASKGRTPFSAPGLMRYCDRIIGFNSQDIPLNVGSHGHALIKSLLDPEPHLRPNANDLLRSHWLTSTQTISIPTDMPPATSSPPTVVQNFNSFLNSTLSVKGYREHDQPDPPAPATTIERTNGSIGVSDASKSEAARSFIQSPPALDPNAAKSSSVQERRVNHNPTRKAVPENQDPAPRDREATVTHRSKQAHDSLITGGGQAADRETRVPSSEEKALAAWCEKNKPEMANQESLVHLAAGQGQLHILKMLVAQGARIQDLTLVGESALHYAAKNGHLEVVKWLVEQGAAVDAKDGDDWQPLHYAAREGNLEVVQWLVPEHGAALDAKDERGLQPLHIAARSGYVEVVKWLVKHGASIDAKSKDDWQPLHYAAFLGNLEVVKFLVESGANVTGLNKGGKTPQMLANQDVEEYLKGREAKKSSSRLSRLFKKR